MNATDILKGLRTCSATGMCRECPFDGTTEDDLGCCDKLLLAAADLIERQNGAVEKFAELVTKAICDNTYPDFDKEYKPVNIWKAKVGYGAIDELVKKAKEEAEE